jgi:hypothetical protein
MYDEEKKFGWSSYKNRIIILSATWILAIIFRNSWGSWNYSTSITLAIIFSLAVWVAGAWENELRYQTPSQIVAENGLHGSFHPFALHHKGKHVIVAVGGISAGGFEMKGGEGTWVFPSMLLYRSAVNPSKILYVQGAPCKCSIDALPVDVRDYIINSGFGELKGPYYYTQTPLISTDDDADLAGRIKKMAGDEETIKDLQTQIAERDKIINRLIRIHEQVKDFKSNWRRKIFGEPEKPAEA